MAKEVLPSGVVLYDPLDYASRREAIFDDVRGAFEKSFPRVVNGVRMELADLSYKHDKVTLKKEKDTLMNGGRLSSKLKGTVRLYDDATNTLLDEKKDFTVANVPYFTDRGTFVDGANDYTVAMQARLLPGVYHRFQANGNLAAQFNTRRGGGPSFSIVMDPTTALYKVEVQGRTAPLYPLMKAFGVSDKQLEDAWGPDVLSANRKDDPKVVPKLYMKLMGRKANPAATPDEMASDLKGIFESGTVNGNVLRRNLPNVYEKKVASAWSYEMKYGTKRASKAAEAIGFKPDYTPTELVKMGVPSTHKGAKEWLSWYTDPKRDDSDPYSEKMMQRWSESVHRQVGNYKLEPTADKALNLIRWGVNPLRHTPADSVSRIVSELRDMTAVGLPEIDDDDDSAYEYGVSKGKGGDDLKARIELKRTAELMFLHDKGELHKDNQELEKFAQEKLASFNESSDLLETQLLIAFASSIVDHD